MNEPGLGINTNPLRNLLASIKILTFSLAEDEETSLDDLYRDLFQGSSPTNQGHFGTCKCVIWGHNLCFNFIGTILCRDLFSSLLSDQRFTASDEVWDDYLKAHPNDTNLRYGIFQDYEDLEIAIGNGVAVGKNSIGLGGATDARTLGVGEGRDIRIEDFDYDVDSDVFVRPNQNDRSFRSTSPLGSPEILEVPKQGRTQNKRNRTEYEGNTPQSGIMEQLNKISTTFE
ncbi:uncharacterized protein LOC133731076 [Rosa rugosa]|uniref:uncharacterized protein LOC133731076 n=1 Tax=Rosa rugosa TaxID=74645 RepID=UPI002B40126C|nr:uncharacterized protein LOC133731076 [Rosa rugosa]